jgi:hypothetical protein
LGAGSQFDSLPLPRDLTWKKIVIDPSAADSISNASSLMIAARSCSSSGPQFSSLRIFLS